MTGPNKNITSTEISHLQRYKSYAFMPSWRRHGDKGGQGHLIPWGYFEITRIPRIINFMLIKKGVIHNIENVYYI